MWRQRLATAFLVILFAGGAVALVWYLLSPNIDQQRVPLFIAALASFFSAVGAIASWSVVREMQHDRDDLFKPDVYADFEADEGLFSFVVRNEGQTAARNVAVMIDPIPIGRGGKPIDNVSWLHQPIKTLLPGKSLKKTIDSHASLFSKEVPRQFTVSVEYESSSGRKYKEGPHTIDLEEYRNTRIPPPRPENSFQKIADHLDTIAKK